MDCYPAMEQSTKRTTLITGASGGIGYALARICAIRQEDLALVARSGDQLNCMKKEFEEKFGINVHMLSSDLSQPGQARTVYDWCDREGIKVDHLINNAGFGDYHPVAGADPDLYAQMLHLNVISLTELYTLFVKPMTTRGYGRILNIGSTAGYQPVPRLAVYAASKSYVVSFTEALHAELKGTGVSATLLSPGPTETGFRKRAAMTEAKLGKNGEADVDAVARAGYKAMMKGRLYVIPGWKNKLLAFSTRLMPSRRAILAISDQISRPSKSNK